MSGDRPQCAYLNVCFWHHSNQNLLCFMCALPPSSKILPPMTNISPFRHCHRSPVYILTVNIYYNKITQKTLTCDKPKCKFSRVVRGVPSLVPVPRKAHHLKLNPSTQFLVSVPVSNNVHGTLLRHVLCPRVLAMTTIMEMNR